jgi:hypothetical protein
VNRCIHDKPLDEQAGRRTPFAARRKNLRLLLKIVVALCAAVVLELVLNFSYGQKPMEAMEQQQRRKLYVQNDQSQSPTPGDQSVHHSDLDTRADLIGVEQDFMRGPTNFNDPGYRDLPNAAQMQISPVP